MIANITAIMVILSVSDEIINNGTLQKGTAISRTDDDEGIQIYKYYNYLTSPTSNTDSETNDNFEATMSFEEEKMYLISGKFSITQDGVIYVSIITSVHLPLDKEDIPTMKPTISLLEKTMNYAQLSELGFTLQMQVKPYLSKDQFNSFLVNLTHPPNGRFKNALTKARKNSTVYTTGLFFFAENQLFCEILEFQFVSAKVETDSTVTVPWGSKMGSHVEASSTSPKSAIERRIASVKQGLATQPPSSTKTPISNPKNKRKMFTTKVSNISKSLLSRDQQIADDVQERSEHNEDIVEDNEETIEDNNDNTGDDEEEDHHTSTTRITKKRRSNRLRA
jgi:hypothetical protein